MTEPQQTGFRGNLTKEQEVKLKELYGLLSRVLGVNKDDTPKNNKPLEKTNSETQSVSSAKKPARRRTFFGWGSSTTEETKPANNENTATANGSAGGGASGIQISDVDDKYGQTKEFYDALAKYSPEELKTAFWDEVKQDHPDAMLLRFLRARKWDVRKALAMVVSSIQWRKSMRIEDDILPRGDSAIRKDLESDDPAVRRDAKDFISLLERGEAFTFGKDKQGRPICYIRVQLHRIGVSTQASVERLTVYFIESSRLMVDPGVETACIVFDMTNFSLANMDYPPVKFIIKCFEANYPESLGVVLIHKAPWIFSSIWAIIKGWLDPVVAAKVQFTKNTDDICEYIDRDTFVKEFGGDNEYAYEYIEPKEGENEKLDDTATRDSLIAVRNQYANDFQAATEEWINSGEDNQAIKDKREDLAAKLSENYWLLDPYIRARHQLDRIGQINPPTNKSAAATPAVGAQSLSEKKSSEVVTTQPVAVATEST